VDCAPDLGLADSRPNARTQNAPDAELPSITAVKLANETEGATVMLKNVPPCYTRTMLVDALDGNGFYGKYSFVYLPFNFGRKAGNGYALVCPVSSEDGASMIRAFEGFEWPFEYEEPCAASWSEPHQGLEEHIERYRNSPVMHPSVPDDYRPMLFENGVRIQFPAPTKTLKPPRIRHVRAAEASQEAAP
jgi:hypothetical protein